MMSYSTPPSFFQKGLHDTRGLIVTGTHSRCGKTVACAGLAGILNDLGFQIQAIKPLYFLPPVSLRKGYEQAYFDRLRPPLQAVDVFSVESSYVMSKMDWQRLLDTCNKRVYPYILETPGSIASPLRYDGMHVLDSVELAKILQAPLLVVTTKQSDIIGCMATAFAYLTERRAPVAGWMVVETTPPEPLPTWEQDILYLSRRYTAPYLGELGYSPSISVEAMQQGNLYRMTEQGIDFLPLQQALDISIPF